ncbi:MAG: divalent-cation tolerance protein CutA [Nitrososphaerales archaeon]
MDNVSIILTTYGSEDEAASAAKAMIERKLAACSTLFRVRSIYTWERRVEDGFEYLVIYKTTSSKADKLKEEILKIHSYKVPELLEIKVDSVGESYLRWILDVLA